MNGRSVARVKYLLRHIDFDEAQTLAQRSSKRRWRQKYAIRWRLLWNAVAWGTDSRGIVNRGLVTVGIHIF